MSAPFLTKTDVTGSPSAMIVLLHGGKPRSHQPVDARSASWQRALWLQRGIAGRAGEAGVGVWLLRYRRRGWNEGTGPTEDARWALDRVREAHGDVPVVLLGHSMGARVAVHVADDPSVRGVVGLAPWWSSQDPVAALAGRTLQAAHGTADHITSFTETARYVERAGAVADSARLVDMGTVGHYMLKQADRWNEMALRSTLEILSATRHD